MSAITTHVLDTTLGRPARGVPVRLELVADGNVTVLGTGVTDDDGRVSEIGPARIGPGPYRLVFDIAAYYAATAQTCFFPEVVLTFATPDTAQHYHVPVLLSPFAYSTYRGS